MAASPQGNLVRDVCIAVVGVALLIYVLAEFDFFERLHDFTRQYEAWELDEFLVGLLLSPLFLGWFGYRRWREANNEINLRLQQEEELRTNREELQRSEARYRSVVDNIKEVVFQTDARGRFTFLNPAWTEVTGFPVKESLGTLSLDYVHPNDRRLVQELFRPLLQGKHDYCRYEIRYLDQEGGIRWIESHTRATVDAAGKIVGTSGTLTDITERKTAEEHLRAQEHYFRSMDRVGVALSDGTEMVQVLRSLSSAILSIFSADRAWFLYPCDPQAEFYKVPVEVAREGYPGAASQETEFPMDELSARLMTEALAAQGPLAMASELEGPEAPDWVQVFQIRSQMILVLNLSNDRPWLMGLHQCTHAHRWSDTEQKLFQSIGQRIEDTLGRLLLTERLREAQSYAHIGHWELNALSGHAYWSDEVYRILGLDPETPAGPKTLATILHPDDKATVLASLEAASIQGGEHFAEYRILRPDGEERWMECRGKPESNANGKVIRLVGVLQDITARKRSQDELARAAAEWTQAMDQFDDAVCLLDMQRRLLRANNTFYRIFGSDPERSVGQPIVDLIHCRTGRGSCPICRIQEERREGVVTLEPDHPNNPTDLPLEVSLKLVRDADDTPTAMLMSLRDLSHSRQIEAHLRLSASVFENTDEGVIITDPQANVLDVNRAFIEITGYPREEVIGRNPRLLQSGRHDKSFYSTMWHSLNKHGQWRGELWNRRKDGSVYPVWLTISAVRNDEGELTHYVGLFSDISLIKKSQEQLDHLAHHDALTDLPNRVLLSERLQQAIRRADRHISPLAVIFLDLDNFKHINDSLGHPAGDELLQQVATRIVQTVRQEDTVARIGGDEFVVLLENVGGPDNVAVAVQKLMARFAEPFLLEEQEIRITASLGICVYPRDGNDPSTLLRNADAAMYRAKAEGRNTYQFYTEELTRNAFERVLLESNLRRALEREELYLLYQPQVDLHTGRVIGLEALIRWQHSELGLVSPAKFIPLAEDSGLIHPIGNWVLRTACLQGKEWLQRGIDFGRIAVNIAGPQIQRGGLPNDVRTVLAETDFPPDRLELEVTEGFIMQQAETAIDQLNELRQLGVALSIDDFGTGYSSLSYLKQLPVHKLKIDQSFVRGIPEDSDDMAISEAVIAMGRSLRLTVIAEGVETQEQADFLKEQGCEEAQGYLYSKPVNPEVLESLLSEQAELVV